MSVSKEAIEALEAARAHILDSYRIWQADDVSAVPPPKSGAGAVIAKIDAVLSAPIAGEGKVKALEWARSGWVEAFSQPDEFGFWYSIQPDKPVHGPGDPPFSCVVIWGVPGQTMRRYLGQDFQNVEAAKAAAQSDYETRILSALISSRGEPCPHCKGEGCQTGDPEGAPLEACDYCNGSGKKISTQPASTALVERLTKALEPFCKHYEPWMERWDDQEASSTFSRHTFGDLREALAAINEARAALSASQSTSREGER